MKKRGSGLSEGGRILDMTQGVTTHSSSAKTNQGWSMNSLQVFCHVELFPTHTHTKVKAHPFPTRWDEIG